MHVTRWFTGCSLFNAYNRSMLLGGSGAVHYSTLIFDTPTMFQYNSQNRCYLFLHTMYINT